MRRASRFSGPYQRVVAPERRHNLPPGKARRGGRRHAPGPGSVMLVRGIEELTLNAWPALNNLLYDGWVLSFSDGYTRRANSIHPLYPSTLPLADKIAVCEATYAARGQETVFKLTSPDHELDATLERLGYASAATTSVQIADLNHARHPSPLPRDVRVIRTSKLPGSTTSTV